MLNNTHYETVTQECPESMELSALQRLDEAFDIIRRDLFWYWHWGDDQGGWFLEKLANIVRSEGLNWPFDETLTAPVYKKEKIKRSLSKQVMERDAYRCVSCGTHIDLSCDHIIPESKGGATVIENLQTMCRPCNSRKGAK